MMGNFDERNDNKMRVQFNKTKKKRKNLKQKIISFSQKICDPIKNEISDQFYGMKSIK